MRLDKRILKVLYAKRNDGKYHNLLEDLNINYSDLIGTVEDLLFKEHIARSVKKTLNVFEDPNENTLQKNVSCKITQAGILYYEQTLETKRTKILSIMAILISIASLILSIIK